jgi:hypothetical protein
MQIDSQMATKLYLKVVMSCTHVVGGDTGKQQQGPSLTQTCVFSGAASKTLVLILRL